MALIVSFVLYYVTNKNDDFDADRKAELERKGNTFVGVIMCISGLSMIIMTMLTGKEDKGNVIPALIIAALGAATNTFFWRRYTVLHKRQGNSILGVQARLYGAKSFVDICVTAALAAVMAMPGTKASFFFDTIGSVIVSLYMIYCGIRTIKEFRK
jgi:divalent metal cation (Fe/Co/Zn/Cd) transporter